ncbi:MAG TPA: hypothetical protein ENH82_05845 [bacterium]|nr:hypothetical protein [bacterium]
MLTDKDIKELFQMTVRNAPEPIRRLLDELANAKDGDMVVVPDNAMLKALRCARDNTIFIKPLINSRGKKMKKIFWDEREGQIVTKGGECLYDKDSINRRLESTVDLAKSFIATFETLKTIVKDKDKRLETLEKRLNDFTCMMCNTNPTEIIQLQHQLQCAAKGHEMIFKETNKTGPSSYRCVGPIPGGWFVFKCTNCNLEIIKTEKELSCVEKEALRKLKLLPRQK